MRDTKLDVLATLFGLERGEFAPGDYEDDADLARRIHVAARHGRSREAIATMALPIGHPEVVERQRLDLGPRLPASIPGRSMSSPTQWLTIWPASFAIGRAGSEPRASRQSVTTARRLRNRAGV